MTAKKKLTTYVVLSHEGEVVTLGPDDDVPDWAHDKIGDHCYADPDGDADEAKASNAAATRRSSSKSA